MVVSMNFSRPLGLCLPFALILGGCSLKPASLSQTEVGDFAASIQRAAAETQVPAQKTLDLYEALGRAIAHNQDIRVEDFGILIGEAQSRAANAEMLPGIVADSQYFGRNTTAASRSSSSNLYSNSGDRQGFSGNLNLSWNILDFGLSYVRAQQAGDKALYQVEQRRKVVAQIIEETRLAFWQALTLQHLVQRMETLKTQVKQQLELSKAQAHNSALEPVAALTAQRELLNLQTELDALQNNLIGAKARLRQLINAPADEPLTLAATAEAIEPELLRLDSQKAIRTALQNRFEIRQAIYEMRINNKEVTAALLQLLPGISLTGGGAGDSNSYLEHASWVSWGAKASWNLIELFRFPLKKQALAERQRLDHQKAVALALAISTQVTVARARYNHQLAQFQTAQKYAEVQQKLTRQMDLAGSVGQVGGQQKIRERMAALIAQTKRDIAYAELQNAYGTYVSSLGIDPLDYGQLSGSGPQQISAFLQQSRKESRQSLGAPLPTSNEPKP